VVIAHAGMNARTVMLWTAEKQKFFSEYGTDTDLGKRRGFAALCIGGEAVALMVERVDGGVAAPTFFGFASYPINCLIARCAAAGRVAR